MRKLLFTLLLLGLFACNNATPPTAEPSPLPPTDAPTAKPTATPAPTDTPEPTNTPTPTNTPQPTDTPTPTFTPTPTEIPLSETDMATFEYALPGDAVYPEGVAFDRPTNSFFVSSTTDGTLYRASLSDPEAAIFSEPGADGRVTAIGLAVDSANRRLWVAGGPSQRMFVYNIDSGDLIMRYDAPSADGSFINDVAVDTIGNAYFTDSGVSRLFKVAANSGGVGDSAEIILDPAEAGVHYDFSFNLNGLAVTPDNQQIILAHSGTPAMFLFTINSGEVVEIDLDDPTGGDGIWLENGMLYSVFRGGVRVIDLADDFTSGEVVQTISDSSFKTPTTLAKVGNRLLVVNAQFGARAGGNPSLPFTVSSVFIPR